MTRERDTGRGSMCRTNGLVAVLLMVVASMPLTAADQERRRDAARGVLLNLTIRKPIVCLRPGVELELALQIRNGGTSTISVEDRGAFYMTHFHQIPGGEPRTETGTPSDTVYEIRTLSSVNDPMPSLDSRPQRTLLKPRESFTKTVKYKLKDDFFSSKGTYSMRLTYGAFADKPANLFKGSLDSNEALFQLEKCDDQR